MSIQPSTSTQVAEKSILDINGRQAYLGNAFVLPQNGKALADENEDTVCVIQNPTNSGKSLFFYTRKVATDNNTVFTRFYKNPTLSATGSATLAVNNRTGSATASVSSCYLSPTVSSKGTLLSALPATIYSITTDVLIVVDPGGSILITGQQSTTGTTNVFLETSWFEL